MKLIFGSGVHGNYFTHGQSLVASIADPESESRSEVWPRTYKLLPKAKPLVPHNMLFVQGDSMARYFHILTKVENENWSHHLIPRGKSEKENLNDTVLILGFSTSCPYCQFPESAKRYDLRIQDPEERCWFEEGWLKNVYFGINCKNC